jgi:hypothetical protein
VDAKPGGRLAALFAELEDSADGGVGGSNGTVALPRSSSALTDDATLCVVCLAAPRQIGFLHGA